MKVKVMAKVKGKVMVIVFGTQIRFPGWVGLGELGFNLEISLKLIKGQGQSYSHSSSHTDEVSQKFGKDHTSWDFKISYSLEGQVQGHVQGQSQGQGVGKVHGDGPWPSDKVS